MPEFGSFDAGSIDPAQTFDALPSGWYAMQIVDSSVEQSKNSDNKFLKIEFEILENVHPEHKGRKAWARLNLWNSNSTAVEIAARNLSAIARATVGPITITNSDILHHKPLAVKLKLVEEKGFDPKNDCVGFETVATRFSGVSAGAPAQAAASQPATAAKPAVSGQPTASAKPPWEK